MKYAPIDDSVRKYLDSKTEELCRVVVLYKELERYSQQRAKSYMREASQYYTSRGIEHKVDFPVLGIEAKLTREQIRELRRDITIISIIKSDK